MDAVAGHVQRLLGGDAPVVCLQAQLVVAQGGLVEHRQPLHRVCGQGLPREGGAGEGETLRARVVRAKPFRMRPQRDD